MAIVFTIIGIFAAMLGTVAIINAYANTPTKGARIAGYANPRSALLVIDLQNDITRSKLYGDTSAFVESVNRAIAFAGENAMEILYIRTEYKNPVMALLAGGRFKPGAAGARFDERLHIVNRNIFAKSIGDGFSNAELEKTLIAQEIDTLYIIGADAAGCVLKTAQGGRNRGYHVTIVRDAVISALRGRRMQQVEGAYEKSRIQTLSLADLQLTP